jgi:UDP-glucuronate 4-epimerase
MSRYLITGAAGFIGYHLTRKLLETGCEVVGLDNINDYYDIRLKYSRLKGCGIEQEEIKNGDLVRSRKHPGYRFIKTDLEDKDAILDLFRKQRFDHVIHLAAQAGVRYSLVNPDAYLLSNIVGFYNILDACRTFPVKHLVYASSSSVYGNNTKIPFSEQDPVDRPASFYAATKKSNELMAWSFSRIYGIPMTGLRFFTVYGPWGRPDMAYFSFTRAILEGRPIDVYNYGEMERDFTYIDDVTETMVRVIRKIPAAPKEAGEDRGVPHALYNIGNSVPVKLTDFIASLEKETGKKAKINLLPMQPGDVPVTFADVSALERDFNYKPGTTLQEGIRRFFEWYAKFYDVRL